MERRLKPALYTNGRDNPSRAASAANGLPVAARRTPAGRRAMRDPPRVPRPLSPANRAPPAARQGPRCTCATSEGDTYRRCDVAISSPSSSRARSARCARAMAYRTPPQSRDSVSGASPSAARRRRAPIVPFPPNAAVNRSRVTGPRWAHLPSRQSCFAHDRIRAAGRDDDVTSVAHEWVPHAHPLVVPQLAHL
jgi:hypothetical protein